MNIEYFTGAAAIRLSLVAVVLGVCACTPTVYHDLDTEDVVALDKDCEVFFVQTGEKPPSVAEKVGSVSIGDSGFTMDCSAERVTEIIREKACASGANVVNITKWKTPDYLSTCYRASADFYSLFDIDWPTIDSDRSRIITGLDERSSSGVIEEIEGIWTDSDVNYEIAIVPDNRDETSADFIAVILEANEHPWWNPMEIKAEIDKTAYPNVFTVQYYLGDRSTDTTTGVIDESGLLKIRLEGGGDAQSYDLLWLKKYPPLGSVTGGQTSSGTCFAVRDDGVLITNQHVVSGAVDIDVILASGVIASATILKSDYANDLAVLKVDVPTPNYLMLAKSANSGLGNQVFTIGYPVTDLLGNEPKYTDGAVSALSGTGGAANLIQMTVPVQPGNSGGPLVDEDGNVIGIVTSTAAVRSFLSSTGTLPQNVNWAVKADYAALLIDEPPVITIGSSRSDVVSHVQQSICRVSVNSKK